ncbi:Os11g0438700 [Oryza sativa Japonica Group]|uniref:Os11g0438700 protein n=1 Tax=Oryza sativa subsp. japonica TaxID=39947 RepID=B7EKL5_ORYSJ|nr:Tropinone reductase, putative, expressed [Oryza sativa Japonica Group]KAB8115141.1 hypothetical protein EE612_055241 [Oryza sativa]BAG92912.1 unnamed protein product [Oryza sativa Japonica Group]BAT13861.1 Os11g0438700 [Oryza sativa Japonica Group]
MQVNCAGMSFLKPAVELTPDDCSQVMGMNFESCFHLSQLAYPLLKASQRGCIINISSIASVVAFCSLPNAVYSAAKGQNKQPLLSWTYFKNIFYLKRIYNGVCSSIPASRFFHDNLYLAFDICSTKCLLEN